MRRVTLLALAFAVLTAAVGAGLLRPVDRYALDHLQPLAAGSLARGLAPPDPIVALGPVVRGRRSLVDSLGAVAFVPADTASAVVLVAAGLLALRRRGRTPAGLAWAAALAAGLAIEGAGKALVDQIPFAPGQTVLGISLDGSYPSGHTIRSVILAAMAAALWPRLRLWAIAWVVLVTALLELGGLHVPSDIAGGLLAGGALAAIAALAGAGGQPGPRQRPLQSGGHAAPQAPRPADLRAPPGAADARSG